MMYLEIGDTTNENASKSDILDAIPARAPSDDWHIIVARDDHDSIEAEGRSDGRYGLTYFDNTRIYEAVEPLDGRDLRQAMADYADGNERWRTGRQWKEFVPSATPAPGMRYASLLPFLATAGALVVFVVGPMLWGYLDIGERLAAIPLPAAIDSTMARLILGFFALCVLIIAVAVVVKLVEARKAASWPSTFGKIVRSQSRFELKAPPGGGMPTNRRAPDVVYELTVGGKTHRGSRISLAEIIDESEVEPILKRYPVGSVVKVHYDPANLGSSVLERDPPTQLGLGCLALLAIGLAGVGFIMWFISSGADLLQEALPDAFLPLMIMTGLGSIILLSLFVSARRGIASAKAWPKTTGTVVSSTTRAFTTESSSGGSSQAWMPVVEYTYTVHGKAHNSRSVRYATEVGGSQGYAEKIAAGYPVGKIVTVYYDPADPSKSALEFRAGLTWLLLILGIALGIVAVISSGVLADWL